MIIIKKVVIRNLKSFRDEIIEFDQGVNHISGVNGAGKSTIFESIFFALFAEFPKQKKGFSKFINNTSTQKFFEITLYFVVDGIDYKVRRKWSKIKREAELINIPLNVTVAEDQDNVTKEILKLIKIDSPKTFSNILFTSQLDIARIVEDTPANRKEIIDTTIGLTKLKNVQKNIKAFIRENKLKIDGDRQALVILKVDVEKIEEEKKTLNESQNQLKQYHSSLNKENRELNKLKKEIELLDSLRDSLLEIKQAITDNRTNIEKLSKKSNDEQAKLFQHIKKFFPKDKIPSAPLKNTIKLENIIGDIKEKNEQEIRSLDKEELELSNKIAQVEPFIIQISDLNKELNDTIIYNQKLLEIIPKKYHSLILGKNISQIISKIDIEKIKYQDFFDYHHDFQEFIRQNNEIIIKSSINDDKLKILKKEITDEGGSIKTFKELIKKYDLLELKDLKNKLDKSLNASYQSNASSKTLIKTLNAKIKNLLLEEEQLQRSENICPTCEQVIDQETHSNLLNKKTNEKIKSENEINSLKSKIEKKSLQIERIERDLSEYSMYLPHYDSLFKIQKEQNELNDLQKDLNDKLRKFLHNKNLTDKYAISGIHELEEVLKNIEYQIEQLNINKQRIEDFNKNSEQIKKKNLKINKINELISKTELKLKPQLERVQNILQNKKAYQNRVNTLLKSLSKITIYLNDIKSAEIERKSIKAKLSKITKSYDPKLHANKNAQKDAYLETTSRLKTYISTLEKEKIPNLKNYIKILMEKKENYDSLKTKMQKRNKKENIAKRIQEILQYYIPITRRKIIQQISAHSSNLFISFYPESGFERVNLTENGQLIVQRYGKEYSASQLSGGEKTACGIAMRIALAKILADHGIILMDEPTESLDSSHREELIRFLEEKIPINQVIIISHFQEISECANHHIEIDYVKKESKVKQS